MWSIVLLLLTLMGSKAHALPEQACVIEGLPVATQHVLKQQLSLMELTTLPSSTTALNHLAEQGRLELLDALLALGYLHPQVLTRTSHDPELIRYRIVPGPPMRLARLDLQIVPKTPDLILSPAPLKQGQAFTHAAYTALKNQWLSEAIVQGYLDAHWAEHIVWVDPDTNMATIALTLRPETPYTLGQITHDPVALTPELLQGYLELQEGMPYRIATLTQTSSRLRSSGYFDHVAWVPHKHDQVVDAHLQLTHKRPLKVGAGFGFGTDTGHRVGLSLHVPRLNAYGHHASLRLTHAQNERHVHAAYHWPGTPPYATRYTLRYQHHNETHHNQRSRSDLWRLEGEIPWRGWQRQISVSFHHEAYRVLEGTPLIRRRLLIPSASWARVRADDPLHTRKGYRVAMHLRGAADALLHHSVPLLQAEWDLKRLTTSGSNTLLTRLHVGTTWANHEDLPLSLRFFAGGDRSVRGFGVHELGPRVFTSSGEHKVVGGKHLVVGSLEWIRNAWAPWGMGLFADAGNAFNGRAPLPVGLGAQLVRQTPLGPLKAAVARPLVAHGYPLRWRLHLSLGPEL